MDAEILALVFGRERGERRGRLDGPHGREVESRDAARDLDLEVRGLAVPVDLEIDLGLELAADAGIDERREPAGRDLVGQELEVIGEGKAGDAERLAAAPSARAASSAAASRAEPQSVAGALPGPGRLARRGGSGGAFGRRHRRLGFGDDGLLLRRLLGRLGLVDGMAHPGLVLGRGLLRNGQVAERFLRFRRGRRRLGPGHGRSAARSSAGTASRSSSAAEGADEVHVLHEPLLRRLGQGGGGHDEDDEPDVEQGRKEQSLLEGLGRSPARGGHFFLSLTSIGSVMTPMTSTPAFLVMSMMRTMTLKGRSSSAWR